MLEIEVRKQRGDFAIDASFASDGAQVTALFGRSGVGKSSLIAMTAGLLRPDQGRVALAGTILFDSARGIDLPPHRRRLGIVFQDGRLFPHLNVRANLEYGLRRAPPKERGLSLAEVIEPLGIGHLLERRPTTLSGGEKHRVAIGRALLAAPRLLLMDEPLASLDGERKAELLPFIAQLPQKFGVPILYVSHAVDEVLRLADRMVLIDAGRVVAAGPVEEVAARADFAAIAALTGETEPFTVVAATVQDHDERLARTLLAFAGGMLAVPRMSETPGTRLRLRIPAGDVMLALAPPSGLSVRNVILARIVAIAEIGALVEVSLDVGCPLRARITRAAREELALAPGQSIYALIKSAALASG